MICSETYRSVPTICILQPFEFIDNRWESGISRPQNDAKFFDAAAGVGGPEAAAVETDDLFRGGEFWKLLATSILNEPV
jgi:hypothetical protein